MQFTVATLFALVASVSAYSIAEHNEYIKRQVASNAIENMDPSVPAMTNANGEVIPFDATQVYKAAEAAGI